MKDKSFQFWAYCGLAVATRSRADYQRDGARLRRVKRAASTRGLTRSHNRTLVLKGEAGEKLLETYNEERLENAKHLLETTDRMFQLATGSEWFLAFFRTNVLPSVAQYILSFDAVKKFVFPLISQIGINYRHGSLSSHAGDENFKVKAGDRMPYFSVDEKSVYDMLRQPKFHLLIFADGQNDYQGLQAELENHYADLVGFNVVALQTRPAEIFGTDKPFLVLLRPDNYIGFISTETSLNGLRVYRNKFVGHSYGQA
jgi:hypothetical protein